MGDWFWSGALALKQAKTGTPIEQVCRKLGISQQTFYCRGKKFTRLGTEELRRLKQREEDTMRLKALVADLSPSGVLHPHSFPRGLQEQKIRDLSCCFSLSNQAPCSALFGSFGRGLDLLSQVSSVVAEYAARAVAVARGNLPKQRQTLELHWTTVASMGRAIARSISTELRKLVKSSYLLPSKPSFPR